MVRIVYVECSDILLLQSSLKTRGSRRHFGATDVINLLMPLTVETKHIKERDLRHIFIPFSY